MRVVNLSAVACKQLAARPACGARPEGARVPDKALRHFREVCAEAQCARLEQLDGRPTLHGHVPVALRYQLSMAAGRHFRGICPPRKTEGRPAALNVPLGLLPNVRICTDVVSGRIWRTAWRTVESRPSWARPPLLQFGGDAQHRQRRVERTREHDGREEQLERAGQTGVGVVRGTLVRRLASRPQRHAAAPPCTPPPRASRVRQAQPGRHSATGAARPSAYCACMPRSRGGHIPGARDMLNPITAMSLRQVEARVMLRHRCRIAAVTDTILAPRPRHVGVTCRRTVPRTSKISSLRWPA